MSSSQAANNNKGLPEKISDNKIQLRQQLAKTKYDKSFLLESRLNGALSSVNVLNGDNNNQKSSEKNLLDIFEKLVYDISAVAFEIEGELNLFQEQASIANNLLLNDLGHHSKKLVDIEKSVNEVAANFQKASEGAVNIGDRLTVAHNEKHRIESAIDLMSYVEYFESIESSELEHISTISASAIKKLLPEKLKDENWGIISQVLHDLRKILIDINSEEVQNAQKNVLKLTEAIEGELLQDFEVAINDLMSAKSEAKKEPLIHRCRDLAQWLHCFNSGQSVQKRYIFSVVQKRIPISSNKDDKHSNSFAWTLLADVINRTKAKMDGSDDDSSARDSEDEDETEDEDVSGDEDDENDSADASDDNDNETTVPPKPTATPAKTTNTLFTSNNKGITHTNQGSPPQGMGTAAGASDQLSELFGTIGSVCQEQFAIIRLIFPAFAIAKVTRLLVQRIFNDPAFGIQARVDIVLCPKQSSNKPPLALPDYLDALVTVREKLSALFLILLEHCTHPALRGIGKESSSGSSHSLHHRVTRNSVSGPGGIEYRRMSDAGFSSSSNGEHNYHNMTGNHSSSLDPFMRQQLENNPFIDEDDERIKSENEVKEFLEEQTSQVLSAYMSDYFEKENLFLRQRYVDDLRHFVDDANSLSKVSTGTILLALPKLKAEKMKSIANITKTVANNQYINSVFNATSDSVSRMCIIGKEDKRLPEKLKEIFLLQLGFLVDGVFLPWSQACIIMLLKLASSSSKSSALPPMEFLTLLAVLYTGINKIKTHFEDCFLRRIDVQTNGNVIVICKEARRQAFKILEKVSKEALHAWILCIGLYVDRMLSNLQLKGDFGVKNTGSESSINTFKSSAVSVGSTLACDSVCKSLLLVANKIRSYSTELAAINPMENIWKPIGRQIVGSLISHLRKQRITMDGAKYVMKDLEEYCNVMMLFEAPENVDLMICLKEISLVLRATPEDVPKMVIEGLRHLDTRVVLAIVKARSDSAVKGQHHWARQLSAVYGNTNKWDSPLPWELKKNMTIVTFAESAAAGSSSQALGPITLRKSYIPVSSSVINSTDISKGILNRANTSSITPATLDFDDSSFINNNNNNNNENELGDFNSTFVPSRPDANSEQSKLMMTIEDIQEAEARALAAKRNEDLENETAAAKANPAIQMKNLINKVGADVNTKFHLASEQAQSGFGHPSIQVQKSLGAIKGTAANIASGVKTGIQKSSQSVNNTFASQSSNTDRTNSGNNGDTFSSNNNNNSNGVSGSKLFEKSNLIGKMSTIFKRS